MRGVVLEPGGAVVVRDDLPRPDAVSGESRVRVLRAGVCATDLALRRGYMDFTGVPGHEFVGVALEGRWRGRRVVGEINAACGRCPSCTSGHARHCPHRTVLGILGRAGAFAEELRLPDACLHPVPDEVDLDAATFTEPLAAAGEILEQVHVDTGTRALVAGDGRLGLLCARVLALAGADVVLAGRHPERASIAGPGVRHVTGWLEEPAADDGETGFDVAVDATGRAQTLSATLARVRPRGTLVLKTTIDEPHALDLARIMVDEITLVGSRCGPFEPALARLANGDVDPRPMIEARYPLGDAEAAFEHAARGGVLKILIDVADVSD